MRAVTVSITYCRPCGYEKRAREAADRLRERLNVVPKLVAGSGGVFKVEVDGKVVATKTKHHFPGADEIVTAVAAARR